MQTICVLFLFRRHYLFLYAFEEPANPPVDCRVDCGFALLDFKDGVYVAKVIKIQHVHQPEYIQQEIAEHYIRVEVAV